VIRVQISIIGGDYCANQVKCYESFGSFSSFLWTAYALLFL
jgi:hypothetical protein